jgi:hypothetical protein
MALFLPKIIKIICMKNFKIHLFLLVVSFYTFSSVEAQILKKVKLPTKVPTLPTSTTELSEGEIANGLKEALSQGATKASEKLHKTDGFNLDPKVRIPFPEDAQKVANKLRELGMGKKVDEFELRLNRAAEQASKEAAPIFVNSIKQMSISDAKTILKGSDTAATSYLRNTTYKPLYDAFNPHIKKALDSTLATKMWSELAGAYNKLPTTKTKVQTDLIGYTTNKGLKGVFLLISEEELKIRKDPMARTTDLLKKVFGSTK